MLLGCALVGLSETCFPPCVLCLRCDNTVKHLLRDQSYVNAINSIRDSCAHRVKQVMVRVHDDAVRLMDILSTCSRDRACFVYNLVKRSILEVSSSCFRPTWVASFAIQKTAVNSCGEWWPSLLTMSALLLSSFFSFSSQCWSSLPSLKRSFATLHLFFCRVLVRFMQMLLPVRCSLSVANPTSAITFAVAVNAST